METINLCWAVYDDSNVLVALFADEHEAWIYANEATSRHYIEDGCYYVERSKPN